MPALEVVEAWTGPGLKDGVITPVAPRENAAHLDEDRWAFEHWYFDARLESGHLVIGFLQTSELVTHKPGVELHIYFPDGTRREIRRHYPKGAAHASRERFDVRVAHNHGHTEFPDGDDGLPVHRIHLSEEDVVFDLEFRNELPSWQPGRGRTTYGPRDYFAWVIGAPRARVTGTVRIGSEVITAAGIGYHDHNWGIGNMGRIVGHWYWGRVYADDMTLIYADVFAQKRFGGHVSKPLMLAFEDRIVTSTGEVEVSTGPPIDNATAHITYPEWLELTSEDVRLRLDVHEVIHAHCLLNDFPVVRNPVLQPLIRRLISPGYFRFRSDYRIEARVDGEWLSREGSTLHEMVKLR
jgi:hypothetical protein